MIITIDGPCASGKSTVARAVAHRLHSYYVYSGLLFRGLAYVLITHKHYTLETIVSPDQRDVDQILNSPLFEYVYDNQKEKLFFQGLDISPELKSSTIDQAASLLSTNTYVRKFLVEYQRFLAMHRSVIADGRDTGSVVFPEADYKFFLTASLQERASRWQKDQERRGSFFTLCQAIQAINERDNRDTKRTDAPLVKPADAFVIDSTTLSVDDVVNQIVAIVSK